MKRSYNLEGRFKRLFRKKPRAVKHVSGLDERTFVEKKHSCPQCFVHIEDEELSTNLYVCPSCNHHFRISATERIPMIADDDFFYEFAGNLQTTNPVEFPGYEEKLVKTRQKTGLDEAVKVGHCRINGREAVVGIMSFSFLGASMGSVVGERITRAIMNGAEEGLPVVLFTASGGARMHETIFSLMQMAKTSNAAALLEKKGMPLFNVLTDPTTGGVTASFAMLGDVTLAEPDAIIGFAGARVISGTIKQKLPVGFQRSEFQLEKGFVDAIVERRNLKQVLSFLIDTHTGRYRGRK
ncbi:MAG: acetyl-CoA carboxylase, carboxyltransferase subunit beta [Spirochaetia bacterium]